MAANKFQLSSQIVYTRQPVADANATILASTTLLAVTSLTASRTLTLPDPTKYPVGLPLIIADESGNCSATITLAVVTPGSSPVTLATLSSPNHRLVLSSTGTVWVAQSLSRESLLVLLNAVAPLLPTTLPSTAGVVWNDGGVVSIS